MILLLLLSIAIFAVDLSKAIFITKQVFELEEEQRGLLVKAAQFNKEAAKLTSPSTFAQCAKLQRTAIYNEKQAEKLTAQQEQVKAHWLQQSVPRVKFVICVCATIALWARSATQIDIADTWPLTRWLAGVRVSKYDLHGSVAIAPYLAITQVVSDALVRALIPQAWG